MRQSHRRPPPTGPELKGDQLAQLWVWTWAVADESIAPTPAHPRWAHDEALRLAEALNRSVKELEPNEWKLARYGKAVDPVATGRIAHYLLTRVDQWRSLVTDEAVARLDVASAGLDLLCELLGETPEQLRVHLERLEIGARWPHSTVFRPQILDGVVIEDAFEGPALPAEYHERLDRYRAAFQEQLARQRARPRVRRFETTRAP